MSSVSSAGQRRGAYQCLKCWHRNDRMYVEARYRVYNHYMKEHVSLDAVPFYCRWRLFRAFKREDMVKHVTNYPRHRAVVREKGAAEDADYLVENRSPYVITERDVVALSAEESQQHWQRMSGKRGDVFASILEATHLDDAVTPQEIQHLTAPSASPAAEPVPPQAAQPVPPPATISAFLPAAAPIEQPVEWRALSPSVQTVVDVSQYLTPLQQLVNILGTGQPSTIAPAAESGSYIHTSVVEQPVVELAPVKSTAAPPPMSQSPVTVGVFDGLPTREDCRALTAQRLSTSASSSSSFTSISSGSSNRDAERHAELMGAVKQLKDVVFELKDRLIETCQSTQHMAQQMLNLAAICAKQKELSTTPPQMNPPTVPMSVPPPPPVMPFVPLPTPVQPPPLPRPEERRRDRSPLRVRVDRQRPSRRERSRDSEKENSRRWTPGHRNDRCIVNSAKDIVTELIYS